MALHHYPQDRMGLSPRPPDFASDTPVKGPKRSTCGPAGQIEELNSSLAELLLQDLRVENGCLRLLHLGSDRSVAIAPTRRPSLYAALAGSVTITLASGESVRLEPGEIAIVFYGDGHRVGDGPNPERLVTGQTQRRTPDRFEHCHVDGNAPQAVVLQAICDLGYFSTGALSHRAAPDLFVMLRSMRDGDGYAVRIFPFDAAMLLSELDGPGGQAIGFAFANLHLCHAVRQYATSTWAGSFRNIRNPNLRRVCAVLREIRGHPERDWTVDSMAAHVGLSRSAFALAFQEIVGQAPMGFLNRERMERAAKLLVKDSLSMHEVGRRVGYDIESSFARAFKRHWGVPPRAFAKNCCGTEAN